jgi:NADH:ubiquinone oxidoreductase subunit H
MIVGSSGRFLTLRVKEKLWLPVKDERSSVVGFIWFYNYIADGLKLIVKEPVLPTNQFSCLLLAPILSFIFSTMLGAILWRKYCHS